MELYIRLDQGQPVDHPMDRLNMQQVWPDLDFENLPEDLARFVRIQPPVLGPYQINTGSTYEWSGNTVQDTWHIREMTPEEKTAKQNHIKEIWSYDGYPSWIFDEEQCNFYPPVPRPDDGQKYMWDESQLNWVVISEE